MIYFCLWKCKKTHFMKNIFKKIIFLVILSTIIISCNRTNVIEPEMVKVEGGTFLMGCTSDQEDDCYKDEKPAHKVTLTSFNISKYEITQEQWNSVMGTNPLKNSRGGKYPVRNISWNDAQEFCSRLSAKTGKQYRLPTEAEWEYAARGGNQSRGYKYSGSDNINDVGWYDYNSGGNIHPIGRKLPNELGIYDMSGNVWEWCCDKYVEYSISEQEDPVATKASSVFVARGGSWAASELLCRVSFRYA
jgi:formylglycine-generating enzyme required for sulfatase activity